MNATEIQARITALPELPTVVAASMIYAQGWRPTAQERAAIAARSEFFKWAGMGPAVTVPVVNFEGGRIGSLTF